MTATRVPAARCRCWPPVARARWWLASVRPDRAACGRRRRTVRRRRHGWRPPAPVDVVPGGTASPRRRPGPSSAPARDAAPRPARAGRTASGRRHPRRCPGATVTASAAGGPGDRCSRSDPSAAPRAKFADVLAFYRRTLTKRFTRPTRGASDRSIGGPRTVLAPPASGSWWPWSTTGRPAFERRLVPSRPSRARGAEAGSFRLDRQAGGTCGAWHASSSSVPAWAAWPPPPGSPGSATRDRLEQADDRRRQARPVRARRVRLRHRPAACSRCRRSTATCS